MRRKVVAVVVLCWCASLFGAVDAIAFDGQININAAGSKEFERLPFIGESRARAIVRYRQKKGGFANVEELRQVPEIGEDTFLAIKPYLTLSGSSTRSGGAVEQLPAAASAREIKTQPGEVRLLKDQDYYPVLQSLIGRAVFSIDLSIFLFKTTNSAHNRANELVEELIAARKRGVIINILFEKSGYDPKINKENQKVAERLQKHGVRVRFDSEKTTTHTKIVVIDRRYSLVGSHNFTGSALSHNHEASLLVDNQSLANQLLEYMRDIR
ncbi:MAG: phospholipase D-like domain-containing protein [Desulfobulbaceae bacterium]|nr:phospholipase D-like domain-containing protein [Desulfobulbaceae bacterium]